MLHYDQCSLLILSHYDKCSLKLLSLYDKCSLQLLPLYDQWPYFQLQYLLFLFTFLDVWWGEVYKWKTTRHVGGHYEKTEWKKPVRMHHADRDHRLLTISSRSSMTLFTYIYLPEQATFMLFLKTYIVFTMPLLTVMFSREIVSLRHLLFFF